MPYTIIGFENCYSITSIQYIEILQKKQRIWWMFFFPNLDYLILVMQLFDIIDIPLFRQNMSYKMFLNRMFSRKETPCWGNMYKQGTLPNSVRFSMCNSPLGGYSFLFLSRLKLSKEYYRDFNASLPSCIDP